MARTLVSWLLLCFTALHLTLSFSALPSKPLHKTYIIHMAKSQMPDTYTHHLEWYASKLKSFTASSKSEAAIGDPAERIIYGYEKAFHGFAARLSEEEAEQLESSQGVLAVLPETTYELHTTRSPEFLGLEPQLSNNVWSASSVYCSALQDG